MEGHSPLQHSGPLCKTHYLVVLLIEMAAASRQHDDICRDLDAVVAAPTCPPPPTPHAKSATHPCFLCSQLLDYWLTTWASSHPNFVNIGSMLAKLSPMLYIDTTAGEDSMSCLPTDSCRVLIYCTHYPVRAG